MLGSLNYRKTSGWIKSSGGDFDYRQDMNFNGGEHYANTRVLDAAHEPGLRDGSCRTRAGARRTSTTRVLGVMFDIDLFDEHEHPRRRPLRHLRRARDRYAELQREHGHVAAERRDLHDAGVGLSGRVSHRGDHGRGTDEGRSWSFSLSQQIGDRWRPYATAAMSSLQLSTANDTLQVAIVRAGHIGEAELQEAGIKASFLDEKLEWTTRCTARRAPT